MLYWLSHLFIFNDIHHYLQLDHTKFSDLDLNMLLYPFLPWLTSMSVADEWGSGRRHFFLGWQKVSPWHHVNSHMDILKTHRSCPSKEISSPPVFCLGSSRQNNFQSINRELDLLILASLCKQISSSERWCRFQKQKGHPLHVWDRYCLAALFSSELVTSGCFLCQVIPGMVRGEKRGIAPLCLCISRYQVTNGRAGSNLRVLGFQHIQREMVREDGRGGVPVAKWLWLQ